MKSLLINTIIILSLTVISCSASRTEKESNIVANDNLVQFEVSGSGPYKLVLTDLEGDSIILEITNIDCRPSDFFKNQSRYFFTCSENETAKTTWEVETELQRVMQLDLRESDLKEFEKLNN